MEVPSHILFFPLSPIAQINLTGQAHRGACTHSLPLPQPALASVRPAAPRTLLAPRAPGTTLSFRAWGPVAWVCVLLRWGCLSPSRTNVLHEDQDLPDRQ